MRSELLASLGLPSVGEFLDSERAAEMYCNEELDGQGRFQYLDSTVSVSGLELERNFHGQVKMFDWKEILNGS